MMMVCVIGVSVQCVEQKKVADNHGGLLKRSYGTIELPGFGGDEYIGYDKNDNFGPWNSHRSLAPSPMEVAHAIAAAKQASANVLIAQQQVHAAKENVLHQQRIAAEKEAHSAILTQKSETAAAIQRSEAAAAAQSVLLAQQRLASAKHAVAQQQRFAAAKEAHAAAALQSSAHAAAAEIRRTEQAAARLAAIQRTGTAAAAHHVAATKDSTIGSINAGNNHVPNVPLSIHSLSQLPWNGLVTSLGLNGITGWLPSSSSSSSSSPLTSSSASLLTHQGEQFQTGKPSLNIWG